MKTKDYVKTKQKKENSVMSNATERHIGKLWFPRRARHNPS